VSVKSVPPGAFVTFGTETAPRGKAPITFEVDKSDADAQIEISLPGYKVETRTVRPNGSVDIEVALTKKSRRPGSGSGSGSSDSGGSTVGDDMMDPFAKKKTK
jgi:hypothetical protein